jgi:protein-disulfide isomerase
MSESAPAGWYPEPGSSRERWWDGSSWTEQTRDPQPSPAAGAPATPRPARPIWPWVLGGSALVVAAVVVVAVLVLSSVFGALERSSTSDQGGSGGSSSSTGAPSGADGDGIVLGAAKDGAVRVVTYIDYLCPYCGEFEATNADQLSEWVKSGDVVLEVHPVSILDRLSLGTRYSTRAANAAACVADTSPGSFEAFSALLFANQPAENTEGLSDADLLDLASEADVADMSSVGECIESEQFSGWVAEATDRALAGPLPDSDVDALTGTPTVIVDGVQYTGGIDDPDEFAGFVLPDES